MELRYYLSTLARRKHQILMIAAIVTILTIIATLFIIPTRYKAGLFFTISYRDDQPTEDYKYGNFHATMAAVEFSRAFSGWTKNPKLVDEIYVRAGVNQQEDQGFMGKLIGPLSTKRVERSNIQITVRSGSAQNAEKLVNALDTVLTEKLEEYNTISASKYKMNNPSKAYETNRPKLGTTIPIGIVVGLLLGILLMYLYEYFAGVITSIAEAEDLIGMEKTDLIHRSADPSAYSFLTTLMTQRRKGAALLAGVSINPIRYSLRFTRALAARKDGIVLVDGNLTDRNLHSLIKGHRKMTRGLTDASTLSELHKVTHEVESDNFSIIPAGKGSRFSAALVSQFAESNKSVTLLHTRVPDHTDILTAIESALVILFVQLGRTKADDLRKLRTFLHERDTYLVIIK